MTTAPSTPPPTRRKLIPDSTGPLTDAPSISNNYAPPTPDSNTSSPRTAVAKRLSDLNLRNLDAETVPVRASPKRKRARAPDPSTDDGIDQSLAIGTEKVIRASASPQRVQDNLPPDPINLPPDHDLQAAGHRIESAIAITSTEPPRRRILAKPKARRKQSPPSPPKQTSKQLDTNTWQEHEITGHLMQDADDDGYGINGIGFRPTPAIAFERSQKRKMQLNAWKVRESSEARERRGERRRKLDGEKAGSKTPSFTELDVTAGGGDEASGKQDGDGESSGKREPRIVRFA